MYSDRLSNKTGLSLPREASWAKTNWQSYVVKLTDDINQIDFIKKLQEFGVSTRRGAMCAHLEKPYIDCDGENLINSELSGLLFVCPFILA